MSWCGEKLSQGSVSHSTKCSTGNSSPAKNRISASSWSACRGSSASSSTGRSIVRASSALASATLAPIKRPHRAGLPGFAAAAESEISSALRNGILVRACSHVLRVNGARLLHRAPVSCPGNSQEVRARETPGGLTRQAVASDTKKPGSFPARAANPDQMWV